MSPAGVGSTMTLARFAMLALLLASPALAGCAQTTPQPVEGACPAQGDAFLAIAVQSGGLAPHPEVFTVRASGIATGVVLAQGAGSPDGGVGVPERALHNVSADQVRDVLAAAGEPAQGGWNVTLAFQGRASFEAVGELCQALRGSAPDLARSYPDDDCRDGTTLELTAWTPEGVVVSSAHCQGGQGTAFEDVRLGVRNATASARAASGAPS